MFWEIYSDLCQKRGLSPNAVAKELSITSGTVTGWKQGRAPQNAKLRAIADYFGVSVNYLLGKEDAAPLTQQANAQSLRSTIQVRVYEKLERDTLIEVSSAPIAIPSEMLDPQDPIDRFAQLEKENGYGGFGCGNL